jgi:lipopolysaccharide biosynthesis regulator YciM
MPENFLLYGLLVVALVVGYLLGRRERARRRKNMGLGVEDYIQGLNHLLNERHDLAIDTFVERMAVDGGTVDTHLALGALVRRRGETDKAIRIHQNLLARPALSQRHRHQCELELARDYLAAGLLDRAENLLLELAGKNSEHEHVARELLLEIYQQEKDWSKAADVGRELARQDRTVRSRVAHFECELAQQMIDDQELRAARDALKRAARLDSQCARVPLLLAHIDRCEQNYKDVCRQLRKACELDPGLIVPCLDLFDQACRKLGQETQYLSFLREALKTSGDQAVIDRLASELERTDGADAAIEFRLRELEARPSLGTCVGLLEALETHHKTLQHNQLQPVLALTRSLLERQAQYRCSQCGFRSSTLMWQCPSCRQWSVMKPAGPLDLH